MADFNLGFIAGSPRDSTRVLSGSITAFAETALNDVNQWRTVLAANPAQLPFKLPPTLQGDIDSLNKVGELVGLKIPPVDALESDLKKALGGLANPVLLDVDKVLGRITSDARRAVDTAKPIIEQISWLL